MTTITIKKIPEQIYQMLKQKAVQHHRSLNSEVIACLEFVLKSRRIDPDTLLGRADILRKKISGELTDEDLSLLKDQGRP